MEALQDRLAAMECARRTANDQAAEQLAVDIAAGREVVPENVIATLEAVGWEHEQLFARVNEIKKHEADQGIVAAAADVRDVLRKCASDREALDERKARFLATDAEKRAEIERKENDARFRASNAEKARQRLMQNAPRELRDERAALIAERMALLPRVSTLRHHADEYRAMVDQAEQAVAVAKPENLPHAEHELSRAQRLLADAESRLSDSQSQVDHIDAQLAALKDRMSGAA